MENNNSEETVEKLKAEINALEQGIKTLIEYFIKFNPDVIPVIEASYYATYREVSQGRKLRTSEGAKVEVKIRFK